MNNLNMSLKLEQMNLNNSTVEFDSINHVYHLGDIELQGITSVISKHLFPEKYDNIPVQIVRQAAERGRQIHEDIRTFDVIGIESTKEQQMYAEIKEKEQITTIKNEYLVTDYANFATAIDLVSEVKGELSLIDIKTTYKLDTYYLRWQLSICKYLFEKVNPHLKVEKLYGLHIRDKAVLIPIEPIEEKYIIALLDAEVNHLSFENPFVLTKSDDDEKAMMLIEAINQKAIEIKALQEKEKEYGEMLEFMFNNLGIEKWDTEFFTITKTADYTRNTFDSKKFETDNPELYKQYVKKTTVKGSIKTKLK